MKVRALIPRIASFVIVCIMAEAPARAAEDPESAPRAIAQGLARAIGDVIAVDVESRRFTVRSTSGEITVTTDDGTICLRTKPGSRDLSGATPVDCTNVAVGDRVFARSTRPAAGTTLHARQVVIMTGADLDEKREKERAEWRRRGVAGVITRLDPATQEITLELLSLRGSTTLTIDANERKPTFLRYAKGSARFSDAKPSTFDELEIGDQARVIGDRAPDGSQLIAEQIVSGAFRTVVGKIRSVDTEESIVTIETLDSGEDAKRILVFQLGKDTMLRRLPAEMAARLVAQRNGQQAWRASRSAGEPESGRSSDGLSGSRAPDERRALGGRAPSLSDLLERMPVITIHDLATGEYVAAALMKDNDLAQSQATKLLAGIEPLLRESPARGGIGGGQSLGISPEALDLDMGLPE